MDWRVLRLIACWLGAAMLLAAARPAAADTFVPGSVCHAIAAADEDYAQLVARPERWNCSDSGWSIVAPRAFLRFDLRDGTVITAGAFSTRLTPFRAMRLTSIDTRGRIASRDVTLREMVPSTADWAMEAALPRTGGRIQTVIVRVDGSRHNGLLSFGRILDKGEVRTEFVHELLIAMLCGTLILPLIFNLAFYRVLRERFLLWHAMATAFMLAHTLITSGLINRFISIGLQGLSTASAISVGGGLIAASLFAADLIEPDKLDPLHRRLLRGVAWWVPVFTAFYLFADGPLRALATPLYLASFLPLMGLFGWIMFIAKRRGSRAVNYQIAAWMPLMATTGIRIVSALGLTDAPIEVLVEQHFAMGLEVIITTLGAFDRLMAIRHERDLAIAEARLLAHRAERDPLTGLFNRRALELRFPDMRAGGFHAMAVLDLDRFKDINDTFGHVKGDAVLRAVAEALAPDGDTLAARLGGEEFLILLRGEDVAGRAERRRLAITTRVAALVPGLDRPVTASMGMVELPVDGSLQNQLPPLYARCDRLLYEAKATGRNRTMREKMQSFSSLNATRRTA